METCFIFLIFLHHKITEHFWHMTISSENTFVSDRNIPLSHQRNIQSLYLAMDESQKETKEKSVASYEHTLWVTSKSLETHSLRLMFIHISPIIAANGVFSHRHTNKKTLQQILDDNMLLIPDHYLTFCVFFPCLCIFYLFGNSECQSFLRNNFQNDSIAIQDPKIYTAIDFHLERMSFHKKGTWQTRLNLFILQSHWEQKLSSNKNGTTYQDLTIPVFF